MTADLLSRQVCFVQKQVQASANLHFHSCFLIRQTSNQQPRFSVSKTKAITPPQLPEDNGYHADNRPHGDHSRDQHQPSEAWNQGKEISRSQLIWIGEQLLQLCQRSNEKLVQYSELFRSGRKAKSHMHSVINHSAIFKQPVRDFYVIWKEDQSPSFTDSNQTTVTMISECKDTCQMPDDLKEIC